MQIPKDILPSVSFAAGPAQGLESIRSLRLKDTLFERRHRNPALAQNGLYKECGENLRVLLNVPKDYTLFFYHGGATTAMDAIAWCCTRDSISGLNFGAFSKLWCQSIADSLPKEIQKDFTDIDFNNLAAAPQKLNKNASLILLTPNETSNGAMLPDGILKEIWRTKAQSSLIAWDATSCAGGRELPNYYDIMVFATQKCFAAGAGTAVVILSPAAVKRIEEVTASRSIPYSLNLLKAVERAKIHQTFNTPNTTNIFMVNEACKYMLKNGGVKAMEVLCKEHARFMLDYAAKSGWLEPMVKDEAYRSYTSLTLLITDGKIKDTDINRALMQSGAPNLIDGLEKYSSIKENSLRIACFPFTDAQGCAQFEKLCLTLDYIVKRL